MSRSVLKLNDSAWLFADSYRTPMQVGMLATFRLPEGRPDFVAELVARWREVRHFEPPFNYQLSMLPVPGWKELRDDQVDLDYHFRHSALPSPGSQRELGILVSRLHTTRLDRRYPLWEVHLIEGLEEDKFSLYSKASHSQIDGVGGIRLLRRILSLDPDARDLLPPWAIGTHGPDQSGASRETSTSTAVDVRRSPLEQITAGVANSVVEGARVAGSLTRTYLESVTGFAGNDRAVPYRAPKSIFNERIHTPRRFATQQYSIERMRRIAKAAGGSLNDVFLTVVGGALRRYLVEQNQLPRRTLTANVPVSVREEGAGARVGNAITFLYASLGTDIADPVERIRAIHDSTQLGKARLPEVGGVAMDAYTALLMAPFLGQAIAGVGGTGQPAANLVVSNVPGPKEARYLDGAKLEEFYPLSLLFDGQALNITAISYDGKFNIGFTGCRDSVPSLQRIAVYAGEELAALGEALGLAEEDGEGSS